jgi:hypothetical protein
VGILFAFSHLAAFFGYWRKTEEQIKYVLDNPGDPDQISSKMKMMVTGIFAGAEKQLTMIKRQSQPTGPLELSAADVYEHMLERAQQYDFVALILASMPLAGMAFLLHKAEANADTEAYSSAKCLLQPIFCVSHKTDYVFLGSEFFTEWFCKSEAERKLYSEHLLFRKTRNGSNIFPDRFVEHNVFYVRHYTGKKAMGQHHATTVKESTLLVNKRLAAKSRVRKEKSIEDTERGRQEQKLDKVYMWSRCSTLATSICGALVRLNMFRQSLGKYAKTMTQMTGNW